jgi:adenylate cyclase class 2
MNYKEIEVRFLNIDKNNLLQKLFSLGAKDQGEKMLSEVIFYDQNLSWLDEKRFVRVRSNGEGISMTYKENKNQTIDSAFEIEFKVPDYQKAVDFLRKIGLNAYRFQEKKRHTFIIDDVTVDIDTWPKIPSYIELEGPSENSLKSLSHLLGLEWNNAVFLDAKGVIENIYKIPVGKMTYFTFDKFE